LCQSAYAEEAPAQKTRSNLDDHKLFQSRLDQSNANDFSKKLKEEYQEDENDTAWMTKKFCKGFIKKLQEAVKVDDVQTVANMIHYPCRWYRTNKKLLMITRKHDFIKNYKRIMTPAMKYAILKEDGSHLLRSWKGCKISGGEVWFDPEGIITLNNDWAEREHAREEFKLEQERSKQ